MKEPRYREIMRSVHIRARDLPRGETLAQMDWQEAVHRFGVENADDFHQRLLQFLWGQWQAGLIDVEVIQIELTHERIAQPFWRIFLDILGDLHDWVQSGRGISINSRNFVDEFLIAFTDCMEQFMTYIGRAIGENSPFECELQKANDAFMLYVRHHVPTELHSSTTVHDMITDFHECMIPLFKREESPAAVSQSPSARLDGVIKDDAEDDTDEELPGIVEVPSQRAPSEPSQHVEVPRQLSPRALQIITETVGELAPGESATSYVEFVRSELQQEMNAADILIEAMTHAEGGMQNPFAIVVPMAVRDVLREKIAVLAQ